MKEAGILVGGSDNGQVSIDPRYANRHGLIAGATGSGKTVTLQILAEGFSKLGVPVFMADVKGDLAGLGQAGSAHPKIQERIDKIGIEGFEHLPFPVNLWDVFAKQGTAVRSTISEMGPQLLSELLDLNETQQSVMTLAFEFADDEGLLLVDLNDLRAVLEYLGDNSRDLGVGLKVSKASVNAILRRLIMIEREGGDLFFGEPALELDDFISHSRRGEGIINILAADKLIQSPRLYATFLLWLLSELFESLPEVGDPDKPKLVFFFDEAHLLFKNASRALVDKIEQVARLIRSKGVGIYFVSQSPADIPEDILGQLGNRIQHTLRAYTPKDQKAVRAAAQSFRANPNFDTAKVITELGIGEAIVSVLQEGGVPSQVERVLVRPPESRMGPVSEQERQQLITGNPFHRKYQDSVDPDSAREMLQRRAEQSAREEAAAEEEQSSRPSRRKSSNRQSVGEAFMKSIARSIGSSIGRKLIRGVLGSLLK
ncbi:helicase HerA-like domain-containing protein [uncultured Pseudoteredinibacter sp.]|uniref:helicase HerA-like domain-containing protein n=1 Tax=uncultured Pseudoteredinibacter sp. TaxID=1641701 RepID=UPI0026287DE0|nr:helicase HerA-like domain-containing protein [uncultured Pseudoteredinibacter sp.]